VNVAQLGKRRASGGDSVPPLEKNSIGTNACGGAAVLEVMWEHSFEEVRHNSLDKNSEGGGGLAGLGRPCPGSSEGSEKLNH